MKLLTKGDFPQILNKPCGIRVYAFPKPSHFFIFDACKRFKSISVLDLRNRVTSVGPGRYCFTFLTQPPSNVSHLVLPQGKHNHGSDDLMDSPTVIPDMRADRSKRSPRQSSHSLPSFTASTSRGEIPISPKMKSFIYLNPVAPKLNMPNRIGLVSLLLQSQSL